MVRRHTGFTLIELLIVVAIIGILAAIAVPNFMNARIRATVAKVQADSKGLGEAYTMYRLDNSKWPPHIDGDPAQHRFVTSPVAYFSTSVYDPFQKGVAHAEVEELQNTMYQYHMEPVGPWVLQWFLPNRDRYRSFVNEAEGSAYGVQSFGPNRRFDRSELYNSSNGLRSKGDMYRLVSGKYTYGG